MDNLFEISNDVQKAIDLKKPIVALESTLISHGLPYPDNIKVAKESINAVEDNGSVAATEPLSFTAFIDSLATLMLSG